MNEKEYEQLIEKHPKLKGCFEYVLPSKRYRGYYRLKSKFRLASAHTLIDLAEEAMKKFKQNHEPL